MEKDTIEFDDWPLELGPHLSGAEARKVRVFIRLYRRCFAFSLQDLEGYKRKIHPHLVGGRSSHFWRPYRPSVFERIDVQVRCRELLAANLIKLPNREYAYATVVPSKKDIFGNWTKKRMCGDYRPVNRITKSG